MTGPKWKPVRTPSEKCVASGRPLMSRWMASAVSAAWSQARKVASRPSPVILITRPELPMTESRMVRRQRSISAKAAVSPMRS